MIPLGLVQLALLILGLVLTAFAIASGVWGGAALLSMLVFLALLATTQKAPR